MKKLSTMALDIRASLVLCCTAAVLLTACGGGTNETNNVDATKTAALSGQGVLGTAGTAVTATEDTATAPSPAPSDAASVGSTDSPARVLATATAVAASTYDLYVSTSGSDTNAGTQAAPFRTINRAATATKPSTTVHVAAGTYNGNVSTNISGTSTARIRFVSDTKWGAKIIGTGTESMWTNNANYIDIVGFDITGPGRLGILNWGSYASMSGNHVHNLTVTGGCTGNGGAGIMNANYTGSDNDMIGNVVHDIGVPGACNAVQGLYHANLRGKINNNIVYRVSSFGIHLWHAANNVMIANNTSFANGSASMGGGFVLGTGDSPGGVVLDNTRVVNNIAYANPRVGIAEYCYSGQACIGSNVVVANNLVYGNGTGITMKVGSATGTISANPQFVNYQANGTGNYRLQSTSPAIDKGLADAAPTDDIDNVARPQGVAPDIGAYEFGAATQTPPSDWTNCANEGEVCNFTGPRQVRYGAGSSFATLTATDSIACNNSVFGDPINGVVKTCQYSGTASTVTPPETWTACGSEGTTCSFTGTRAVRYGASASFASKIIVGSTPCTNAVFGDPINGVVKSCSYSSITR